MSTLAEVRDGLAEAIASRVDGVRVYKAPVDVLDPPAVIIAGLTLDPTTFAGAGSRVVFEVFVVVSRRHPDQILTLDALVDPEEEWSVSGAIAADPTLEGVVGSAVVQSVGEYRDVVLADTSYYAATLRVEVMR